MTFFFVRHKREAVAEFSFCNGSFFSLGSGATGFAEGGQCTILAVRFPGHANRSTVQNQTMAEIIGFFRGEDFAQLLLYLTGILGAVGES